MSHGLVLASGYTAPGPTEFFFPDFTGKHWNQHGYDSLLTKSSVLLVVGALVAGWFLYSSSKRRSIVPGRFQFAGEQGYSFIRNGVAQDIIGKGYAKFVPLLVSLFFFLLINNLFGIVPFLSFAPFSRASFAYGLTAMVWILYNGIGIKDKGFFGYLKHTTVPSGVPWPLLFLLVPLEFMSNILVRPLTLSLRLFANMFAGHLLVVLFSTGGAWLLLDATGSVVLKPAGVLAYVMGVGICFLELIVATLQAYVFTLLTATYIGGALAHEH